MWLASFAIPVVLVAASSLYGSDDMDEFIDCFTLTPNNASSFGLYREEEANIPVVDADDLSWEDHEFGSDRQVGGMYDSEDEDDMELDLVTSVQTRTVDSTAMPPVTQQQRPTLPGRPGLTVGSGFTAPTKLAVSVRSIRSPALISIAYKFLRQHGSGCSIFKGETVYVNDDAWQFKLSLGMARYRVKQDTDKVSVSLIRRGRNLGLLTHLPGAEWVRMDGDILVVTAGSLVDSGSRLREREVKSLFTEPIIGGSVSENIIREIISENAAMFALVAIIHKQQ